LLTSFTVAVSVRPKVFEPVKSGNCQECKSSWLFFIRKELKMPSLSKIEQNQRKEINILKKELQEKDQELAILLEDQQEMSKKNNHLTSVNCELERKIQSILAHQKMADPDNAQEKLRALKIDLEYAKEEAKLAEAESTRLWKIMDKFYADIQRIREGI